MGVRQLDEKMLCSNMCPSIHWAQRHRVQSGQVLLNRQIYDFELLYVLEGEGKSYLGDRAYDWAQGQLLYFRSGMPHSLAIATPAASFLGIHFDYFNELEIARDEDIIVNQVHVREELFCSEPHSEPGGQLFPHLIPNSFAATIMEQIIDEFTARRPFYEVQCRALFMQLIVQLLRTRPVKQSHGRYARQVMELTIQIQKHPAQCWSNAEMAGWLNVHEDYFSKIFRDLTGLTPSKYVQSVRHQEAKRLLQTTDWKIETISTSVGYENFHYFSKLFHKIEGMTASDYRALTKVL